MYTHWSAIIHSCLMARKCWPVIFQGCFRSGPSLRPLNYCGSYCPKYCLAAKDSLLLPKVLFSLFEKAKTTGNQPSNFTVICGLQVLKLIQTENLFTHIEGNCVFLANYWNSYAFSATQNKKDRICKGMWEGAFSVAASVPDAFEGGPVGAPGATSWTMCGGKSKSSD